MRNPVEPASRKTQALEELNKARVNIQNSLTNLQPLIVTPIGKQKIDELSKSLASYQTVQDQYLSLISSGSLDEAVKLSSESMKQSADAVEGHIEEMIDVNNNKAKRAGEEASQTYEQAKLIVGAFILISTLAAIALALMYTRSITSPISQLLAIAERIAKETLKKTF
ncbi:MCP four helix bundle domain-containing protein [Pseudomonas lundensis]|uniref:MCP four helix bundle domain-containing protein n=1 Tax=Pseudomonas lundensis TaxID=86185 RepID=UPI0021CCF771|nr:MCP four helix bundle domain-containing protein [Pseudomonas lundensis]